ncbi:MAG: hypothetical protein HKM95_06115 [Inquilinus sp.]|nr:hypothetical protein [Inquilinus sp.]
MRIPLFFALAALLTASCQTQKSPHQTAGLAPTPVAVTGAARFPEPVEFSPVGHPAGSCLSEEEIAAEQAMRLHTALMVTGLTCHGFYREPTLFGQYQTFTTDHDDRLGGAKRTMGAFLFRYEGGSRDRLLDTYQTRLANAESRLLADASAPTYCRLRRDQFTAAMDFTADDFESYVTLMVERHRARYRVCR